MEVEDFAYAFGWLMAFVVGCLIFVPYYIQEILNSIQITDKSQENSNTEKFPAQLDLVFSFSFGVLMFFVLFVLFFIPYYLQTEFCQSTHIAKTYFNWKDIQQPLLIWICILLTVKMPPSFLMAFGGLMCFVFSTLFLVPVFQNHLLITMEKRIVKIARCTAPQFPLWFIEFDHIENG